MGEAGDGWEGGEDSRDTRLPSGAEKPGAGLRVAHWARVFLLFVPAADAGHAGAGKASQALALTLWN